MSFLKKLMFTLFSLAFFLAISKAELLISQASISISKFFFRAISIAPLPQHKSIPVLIFLSFNNLIVFFTFYSVSKRGINTFSSTLILQL